MNNFPIIRIEIERVRCQVNAMLADFNNEINEYVINSLENQLTEDWVIKEIDAAVKSCLKSAIADIANNPQFRSAITGVLSNFVAKKLNDK